MKVILDAGCMNNREETHAYLKEKLELPAYYGNNLDGLYDCLTELVQTEVTFIHVDQAGEYYKKVYRVFLNAAGENSGITVNINHNQQEKLYG